MHILLCGLRGSGKTSVARALAALAGRSQADLDTEVCRALGAASVSAAFAEAGEARWRDAEAEVLQRLLAVPDPLIIALGGGAVTAPGIAQALRGATDERRAALILLDVPREILIARRRSDDQDRPPLYDGATLEEEIDRTWSARMPLYRGLATHICRVSDRRESAEETAARVRTMVS